MKRLLIVAVFLSSAAPLFATLASPNQVSRDVHRPPTQERVIQVDDDTEIMLNGLPSSMKDIPDNAEIILLEVSKGRVVRLHFRSVK